jgi:UDP-N-acetylglucosamine:LPS N-acetylglucosamine transferase
MDLVISRAGFNTISQCIVHRVPMVLVDEDGNPEIHENLNKVSALGLCVPLTIADYQRRLNDVLRHVFAREYGRILANIRQFKADGAERVARDILKRLGLDAGLAPSETAPGALAAPAGVR